MNHLVKSPIMELTDKQLEKLRTKHGDFDIVPSPYCPKDKMFIYSDIPILERIEPTFKVTEYYRTTDAFNRDHSQFGFPTANG